ncbi:MAG TPA: cytochrome c biogenesis protein CcdA [Kiritimatiellia bacterium]|nr:cytochrome c biogenesis protein CcdA [Kiritimatiellia bacterium]HRZ10958.1 cytochrome c biogenesis protein CcdA [Kiritimatiellia bacterium]HSA18531.1 cytochrome c biogenesis protein CcdA [Kiritimatiellia bacterium]
MRGIRFHRLAGLLLSAGTALAAESPFVVTASFDQREGQPHVRVHFQYPPGHYLYADSIHVAARAGAELVLAEAPTPTRVRDKHSGGEKAVLDKPHDRLYQLPVAAGVLEVEVSFQGCDASVCYFPEKRIVPVGAAAGDSPALPVAPGPASPAAGDWRAALERFSVAGTAAGYVKPEALLEFLGQAESGAAAGDGLVARWQKLGWLATLALILAGGVALNLTPCVLPMIPVNLAIIGAGARAGSRRRGFALGGVYGLGMALAYGLLGVIVVLTGARFGALNASPWFNAAMAGLFVALSLAMFDVFEINLSRFQGGGAEGRRGGYTVALVMGAVSALLAGACVAPVLISVLVLAGHLYGRGIALGLLLPFVLGLGMALPWPLAGAGLSFLPKPGRWMTVVRNLFGVLILLLALYYGYTAYRLFRPPPPPPAVKTGASNLRKVDSAEGLAAALDEAAREGRPVFLDFWATWCKNCLVMEKTTFKDPAVAARLAGYLVVKFQAEQPGDPPASDILDRFGAIGLPTYAVLKPVAGSR